MARTTKERERDRERVEQALLGNLLPAGAKHPDARRIHVKVVGVTHTNEDGSSRQAAIEKMAQFDSVHLVRNHADPHDPFAIQVYADYLVSSMLPASATSSGTVRRMIGHIPWELAAELAPALDAGEPWQAIATRVGGSYGTLGVSLMIYLPV